MPSNIKNGVPVIINSYPPTAMNSEDESIQSENFVLTEFRAVIIKPKTIKSHMKKIKVTVPRILIN